MPEGYTGSFTSWWSDTRPRERGGYVNGQRDGAIRVFHPDGSLAEEGEFRAGVPVGRHLLYHRGGVLALVENVVHGVVDGERTEFDEQGRLKAEQSWVAGRREGAQRVFHPDGSLAQEGRWHDDLPVGRWTDFDPQGHLSSEEWYWAAGGKAVGYLETVHAADGRITTQALKTLRDGSWLGWRTYWHQNGVQAGLVEYRDELRDGRDVSWSPSGLPLVQGQRRGDLRVGRWRFWDEQGEPAGERDYGDPDELPAREQPQSPAADPTRADEGSSRD